MKKDSVEILDSINELKHKTELLIKKQREQYLTLKNVNDKLKNTLQTRRNNKEHKIIFIY